MRFEKTNTSVVASRLTTSGVRIPQTEVWGYDMPSLRD
jgi:hypothetical protein